MVVTNVNEKGRIFIDKYELKKTANYIINNLSDKFKFIEIKINNTQIHLVLKAVDNYNTEELDDIRDEIISIYKNRYEYTIGEFDIEIL